MALALFEFQQEAADRLFNSAVNYFVEGQDRVGGRPVPFVGQLKAVTGAGKTPILADVIGRLGPSIVLWTTKYGNVVDQTTANLRAGGRYNHLLGSGRVEVIKFSDITSAADWQRILDHGDGLTVLVSTVAAWNSAEKDERLNVHRVHEDWDSGKSRWDQLTDDRKRKLWVVYDEAHNTTTEQVEQLDDLGPAGFFVASASPIKGILQQYLTSLRFETRQERIVPVSTRAVVEAELLKSTISLADYDSSPEEMMADVVARRQLLSEEFTAIGVDVTPKAIYVVEASNTTVKGVDPRPVAIWKTLVNANGISPGTIAVCTSTKELPKDAQRVERIDQLGDQFTHIIFNKRLQEGWDDPAVYVCYFDGRTDSGSRIQQVLGRAMRQPGAKHLSDEDLNTAYFYINTPNATLERITDQLKEELRIYKSAEEPDDFEPFKFVEQRKVPAKIQVKPELVGALKVPLLQLELPRGATLETLIRRKTLDFSVADRAAPGKAVINVVSVKTGDVVQDTRDLLEDMRIRCGTYLQDQIRSLSRNCANAIPTVTFTGKSLDKTACYTSKALDYYHNVAVEVVREYEEMVKLAELDDPDESEYVVGSYQPSGPVLRMFDNAGHVRYDSKAFNDDELEMAKALDAFPDYVWVRNKERVGYGIPLPTKSGSSSNFYPDFLWWVRDDVHDAVWAIDPTGKFILDEKLRTKLLTVPNPLKIALVTKGKLDGDYRLLTPDGWTLSRFRTGNVRPETFSALEELLARLVGES